jgi:hypothetical protein
MSRILKLVAGMFVVMLFAGKPLEALACTQSTAQCTGSIQSSKFTGGVDADTTITGVRATISQAPTTSCAQGQPAAWSMVLDKLKAGACAYAQDGWFIAPYAGINTPTVFTQYKDKDTAGNCTLLNTTNLFPALSASGSHEYGVGAAASGTGDPDGTYAFWFDASTILNSPIQRWYPNQGQWYAETRNDGDQVAGTQSTKNYFTSVQKLKNFMPGTWYAANLAYNVGFTNPNGVVSTTNISNFSTYDNRCP